MTDTHFCPRCAQTCPADAFAFGGPHCDECIVRQCAAATTMDLGPALPTWDETTPRTCTECARTLPVAAFAPAGTYGTFDAAPYFLCLSCPTLRARCAKYGITTERFHQLYAEQDGGCGVCETPEPVPEALVIDHCHQTGLVRGLLCPGCNVALGFLRDDPARADGAARYLRANGTKRPFSVTGPPSSVAFVGVASQT